MTPTPSPTCGNSLPEDGKCVSCNMPPRDAAIKLTLIVAVVFALAALGWLFLR